MCHSHSRFFDFAQRIDSTHKADIFIQFEIDEMCKKIEFTRRHGMFWIKSK